MIATDTLSLIFLILGLTGFAFFVVTALLGNLGGHGHAMDGHGSHGHHLHLGHQGHGHHFSILGILNPNSLFLFLFGFGFSGYLFHNATHLLALFVVLLALVCGLFVAGIALMLIDRIFGDSEADTVQDVSDRTGMIGKVSLSIPEHGMGEIIYVSPAGMRKAIPARSIDGRPIPSGQEVVVVSSPGTVAEVDTWDHFMATSDDPPVSPHSKDVERLRAFLHTSDLSTSFDSPVSLSQDGQKE